MFCSLSAFLPSFGTTLQTLRDVEGPLTKTFKAIFDNSIEFGGSLFGVAATLLCDFINNDPQSLKEVYESGIARSFLAVLTEKRVPKSAECLIPIPNVIRSLCLTSDVSTYLLDQQPLDHLMHLFLDPEFSRVLTVENAFNVGSGLDELLRHAIVLREPGMKAIVRVLHELIKMGEKMIERLPVTIPG